MTFRKTLRTPGMQSNDSSGEEAPLAVRQFTDEGMFPGVKGLKDMAGQQPDEQSGDRQRQLCSPPNQQIDKPMTHCKASDEDSIAKKPSLFRNQSPLPSESHIAPAFRRSVTPMPVQKSLAKTLSGRTHRTPSVPRSNAPSLSDYSVTVRSPSHDQQDNIIQWSKPPRNSGLSNDEKSLAQVHLLGTSLMLRLGALSSIENTQPCNQGVTALNSDSPVEDPESRDRKTSSSDLSPAVERFHNTALNGLDEQHLTIMRSPSWSPLTTPPASPLAPTTDIVDEDVDYYQTSSQRASPVGQPCNRTFEVETVAQQAELNNCPPRTPSPRRSSRTKLRHPRTRTRGQNGRVHFNGGRRQAAPTRWSPVIPWSPNRKASFHYDVQQRLAAATRGTHVDNGLLKVTREYFDI